MNLLDARGVLRRSGEQVIHHGRQFAAAFTEKLATYALRRGMTFSDREELQQIAAAAKKTDYQLLSLIESLIASPLFLKR